MKSNCLEEGILQSYLDNELTGPEMESASLHLRQCPVCKLALQKLQANDEWLLPLLGLESRLILIQHKEHPLMLGDTNHAEYAAIMMTALSIGASLLICLAGTWLWTPILEPLNTHLNWLPAGRFFSQIWIFVIKLGTDSSFIYNLENALRQAAALWSVLLIGLAVRLYNRLKLPAQESTLLNDGRV